MNEGEDQEEEWYILQGMRSTNGLTQSNTGRNTLSQNNYQQQQQQEGWYSLEEYGNNQSSSNRTRSKSPRPAHGVLSTIIGSDTSSNHHIDPNQSIDFSVSPSRPSMVTEENEDSMDQGEGETNFGDRDAVNMRGPPSPSPVSSSRLLLQESIDGDVSSTSDQSAQSDSQWNDFRSASRSTKNYQKTNNSFSPLATKSKHQGDEDPNNHEWINLTDASNMQDVDRPDPIGRTELNIDVLNQKQVHSKSTGLLKISPRHSSGQRHDIQGESHQDVLQTQQQIPKRSASHSPPNLSDRSTPRAQRSSPQFQQDIDRNQQDSHRKQQISPTNHVESSFDGHNQQSPTSDGTTTRLSPTADRTSSHVPNKRTQERQKSWAPQQTSPRGLQDVLQTQQVTKRSASYSPSSNLSDRSSPQFQQDISHFQQDSHHTQQMPSENYVESAADRHDQPSPKSDGITPQLSPATDRRSSHLPNKRTQERQKSWAPQQTSPRGHQDVLQTQQVTKRSASYSPSSNLSDRSSPQFQQDISHFQQDSHHTQQMPSENYVESAADRHDQPSPKSDGITPQLSPATDRRSSHLPNKRTQERQKSWAPQQTSPRGHQDLLQTQQVTKRSASHSPSNWNPQSSPRAQQSSPQVQHSFQQQERDSQHVAQIDLQMASRMDARQSNSLSSGTSSKLSPEDLPPNEDIPKRKQKSRQHQSLQQISTRAQQDSLQSQQYTKRSASHSPVSRSPQISPRVQQSSPQVQQDFFPVQPKLSMQSTSNLKSGQFKSSSHHYKELVINTQQEQDSTLSNQTIQDSPDVTSAMDNTPDDKVPRKTQRHSWTQQTPQGSQNFQQRSTSHSPSSWSSGSSPRIQQMSPQQGFLPTQQHSRHVQERPSSVKTSDVNQQISHQQTTRSRGSHRTESTQAVGTSPKSPRSSIASDDICNDVQPKHQSHQQMSPGPLQDRKRSASHSPSSWSPQSSPRAQQSSPQFQQDTIPNQQSSRHAQQKPSSNSTSNVQARPSSRHTATSIEARNLPQVSESPQDSQNGSPRSQKHFKSRNQSWAPQYTQQVSQKSPKRAASHSPFSQSPQSSPKAQRSSPQFQHSMQQGFHQTHQNVPQIELGAASHSAFRMDPVSFQSQYDLPQVQQPHKSRQSHQNVIDNQQNRDLSQKDLPETRSSNTPYDANISCKQKPSHQNSDDIDRSSHHIQQNSNHIQQNSNHIQQNSNHIQQSSHNTQQSSRHIQQTQQSSQQFQHSMQQGSHQTHQNVPQIELGAASHSAFRMDPESFPSQYDLPQVQQPQKPRQSDQNMENEHNLDENQQDLSGTYSSNSPFQAQQYRISFKQKGSPQNSNDIERNSHHIQQNSNHFQQTSHHTQQRSFGRSTSDFSSPTYSTNHQHDDITDTMSKLSIKSKTTTDSDIQELSYTQSLPDPKHQQQPTNKKLSHIQDPSLQQSYSTGALSGLSSTSGKKSEFSSSSEGHFVASRFSNETPVTKLLGPAYKQTERFLKDLQHAKLSYTNNETNHSDQGFNETAHSKLSMSVSTNNESMQFGKSMTSKNSFQQNLPSPDNLTEQDIASASIVDVTEANSIVGNTTFGGRNQSPSNDEHSEGELLISELSQEASARRRSSISKTTSTSHTSSLEPIKEVLSPEKSINNRNHFPLHHRMMNSTSTPNLGASGRPSTKGIYDMKDSTSPGSTNRKRMVKSVAHLHHRYSKQPTDPFKVYVSEGSQRAETASLDPQSEVSHLSLTTNAASKRSVSDVSEFTNTPVSKKNHNYPPSEASYQSLHSQTAPTKQSSRRHVQEENLHSQTPKRSSIKPVSKSSKSTTTRSPLEPVSEASYSNLTTSKKSEIAPASEVSHLSLSIHADTAKRSSHKHSPSKDMTLSAYRNIDTPESAHHVPDSPVRPRVKQDSEEVPPLSYSRLSSNENNNHLEYSSSRHEDDHPTPKTLPKRSRVYPKSLAHLNSDSSYVGNETTDSDRSKHEERRKNLKNASLNQLWESFERSYRDTITNNEKSPLLKKLEVVSKLLKERSLRRRHVASLTDDTDTSAISYCEAHTPRQSLTDISNTRDKTRAVPRPSPEQKPGKAPTSTNLCPVCQRREIGTNFPTPTASEFDANRKKKVKEEPLTLQTWTQTSPYIIESEGDSLDKKKQQRTVGLHSPSKGNRSWTSSSSGSGSGSKNKDIPYTAWFQSVRSDNSDVIPLCKIPELGSLYSDTLEKQLRRQEKRQEPRLTLQDAFRRRKKKFIRSSETRLQEFRDVYQQGKHGPVFNGKGNYLDGNIAVERPQDRLASNRTETERSRGRSTRKSKTSRTTSMSTRRSPGSTARSNYQLLEEQRVQDLRRNRMKMKQYDMKNRDRFLKRRGKRRIKRRPQYVVERH
eukprot:TCONS_00004695-protein